MCCPSYTKRIFECKVNTLMMVQTCMSSSNMLDCNISFLNTLNEKHLAKSSRLVQYHCYNASYPWVQL